MTNLKIIKSNKLTLGHKKYKKWIVYDPITKYTKRFRTRFFAKVFIKNAIKRGY